MIEQVGLDDFEEEVLKSDVPVLVDFWWLHCLPCKKMDPVLEEAAGKIGDKGRIVGVQFENSRALVEEYGVETFPTMILFKDGQLKKRLIGPRPIEVILELFE